MDKFSTEKVAEREGKEEYGISAIVLPLRAIPIPQYVPLVDWGNGWNAKGRATIICRLIRHTKCVGQRQWAKIAEINFHSWPTAAAGMGRKMEWKKGRANEAFGGMRERIPSGKRGEKLGKENLI